MNRPDHDQYFMDMAQLAATRSNCYRRQVGCVLVDSSNRVLATGYNGVPRNMEHCESGKCPREHPGENLHMCLAIHAEVNAILQCRDVDSIHTAYITDSPCLQCTVILLNTFCNKIVFLRDYPGNCLPEQLWKKQKRLWVKYNGR